MFHELLVTWFHWVDQWGYLGVFLLMAMESSIIPVPSEVVMPPAAFWAAQGRMDFWGVIAAGTLGSYFGSAASYWISQWVGEPVVKRYGKFFLLPPAKIKMAERWVESYGAPGVFGARILPVVRHLISIPSGILHMPFLRFSVATLAGAGIWCGVLAWFGQEVIGGHPELLNSPEEMIHVVKGKLQWFVVGVAVLLALYAVVVRFRNRPEPARSRARARS